MKAFLAVMFAASFSISPAQAGIITIDFEDQTPGFFAANLGIGGFRFSPTCHYDLVPAFAGSGSHPSQWIGFDGSACGLPEFTNQNFLGPTGPLGGPSLWVDSAGTPFSLLGLDTASIFEGTVSWHLTSSNGGFFLPSSGHFDFSGPAWSNISWLLFTDPASGGFPVGFDNITFRVPEPSTALLFAGGLALLAMTRRRRRKQ